MVLLYTDCPTVARLLVSLANMRVFVCASAIPNRFSYFYCLHGKGRCDNFTVADDDNDDDDVDGDEQLSAGFAHS